MKIYNSMSMKIEEFKPLVEGEATMYVCGPTVYNYPHIGNARPIVVFDTLKRTLQALGYKVKMVSNYTDVDDKIINVAKELGVSEKEVTDKFIKAYNEDRLSLHAMMPDEAPRVTETMEAIIAFIVEKGYAYQVDGDVYFRVGKVKEYGNLSHQRIDDLVVGARIDENSKKENPLDFTLWKETSEGIQWDSPWSKGRPGWHTECVVMIHDVFQQPLIDIHGGGMDLKFPHHENEIAQSQAAYGTSIARYWVHNGMININGDKMSKSLGNVLWAKDLIKEYGGNVIRWMMLSAHYRAPLNISEETLQSSKKEYERVANSMKQGYVKLGLSKAQCNGEILDEFYQQMDFTNYGIYEIRSLGMVAERLFGLWFTHQKLHEHYRYKELQCAFFSSIQDENLAPAFPENNVALVLPCNGFHAPLTAVTLQSIVEHSSAKHNYDVIIAERYVPDQYREQLRQIVGARPNFSLRFLSLGDGLDNHFTGDNQDLLDYYKLVIPDILKQYDRVLCLDPSMLAQSDVAELFAQDMGGKPLAAAQDVTVQGMLRMVDTQNTRRYLSQVLCLKDIFQYVNTSVLLMDLVQLRKLHRWNELQRIAEAEHWIWAEQDVINYLYQGQIQFLDQDWNCIASQSINEISMTEYYAPKELYQAYRKALKQPKLLRFHHPMSHLSFYNEIFWATARKTPYYESLVRFA